MKQPELQPNEITLPLIQDGCAVKSPPNLVTMVENGETSQAKFTVSIFSWIICPICNDIVINNDALSRIKT